MANYRVPDDTEFPAEAEYITADKDLIEVYFGLLAACPELSHLKTREMSILWQRKGPKKAGKAVFGACRRPAGLLKHYAGCDFVVTLSADHCREWGPTPLQLEALLYHELLHAGENDKGTPILLDHDFQGFELEVRNYGDWHTGLSQADRSFQNIPQRPALRAVAPAALKRLSAV